MFHSTGPSRCRDLSFDSLTNAGSAQYAPKQEREYQSDKDSALERILQGSLPLLLSHRKDCFGCMEHHHHSPNCFLVMCCATCGTLGSRGDASSEDCLHDHLILVSANGTGCTPGRGTYSTNRNVPHAPGPDADNGRLVRWQSSLLCEPIPRTKPSGFAP